METSEGLNLARELGARPHAELRVDVRQMARHRPLAEKQGGGDLLIRPTLGDKGGDATLRGREPLLARAAADAAELRPSFRRPDGRADRLEPVERRLDCAAR